uniref:Uncharacterized protein n=1 Tax=Anguilla anguilla TaxID=7936 RepID=A0A0E9XE59_ANGAN
MLHTAIVMEMQIKKICTVLMMRVLYNFIRENTQRMSWALKETPDFAEKRTAVNDCSLLEGVPAD